MEAPVTWADAALAFLQAHADKGKPFLVEDVRVAARETMFPDPPDPRAWSSIVVRAARKGYVERIGQRTSKGKAGTAHGSQRALWQRVGIRKPVSPLINEAYKALNAIPPHQRGHDWRSIERALVDAHGYAEMPGL